MLDIFKNSDWIAGWAGLILVLLPVCTSLYSQNTKRKKLIQDIQMYLEWRKFGDPAAVEFCKSSINQRIEKLYSAKTITSSEIVFFSLYLIIWLISLVSVILSIGDRMGWLICLLIYSVVLIIETRKLSAKLKQREEDQATTARIIRMHANATNTLTELDSVLDSKSIMSDDDFVNATENRSKLLRLIAEIEKIAEEVKSLNLDCLESKNSHRP